MIRTLSLTVLTVALASNARAQDSSSSVPIGDECFAMKAYCAGLAEIAMGKLAAEKATEPGVRSFAEKMVKDHTECNEKIFEAARRKGIPLPRTVDPIHTTTMARMARLSGSDFDKAYLMAQIGAHKEALLLFGHEGHKGEDPDLKALAHKTLPTLEAHTKMAFELAGEKREYEKFSKIQAFAKEVMNEK